MMPASTTSAAKLRGPAPAEPAVRFGHERRGRARDRQQRHGDERGAIEQQAAQDQRGRQDQHGHVAKALARRDHERRREQRQVEGQQARRRAGRAGPVEPQHAGRAARARRAGPRWSLLPARPRTAWRWRTRRRSRRRRRTSRSRRCARSRSPPRRGVAAAAGGQAMATHEGWLCVRVDCRRRHGSGWEEQDACHTPWPARSAACRRGRPGAGRLIRRLDEGSPLCLPGTPLSSTIERATLHLRSGGKAAAWTISRHSSPIT